MEFLVSCGGPKSKRQTNHVKLDFEGSKLPTGSYQFKKQNGKNNENRYGISLFKTVEKHWKMNYISMRKLFYSQENIKLIVDRLFHNRISLIRNAHVCVLLITLYFLIFAYMYHGSLRYLILKLIETFYCKFFQKHNMTHSSPV